MSISDNIYLILSGKKKIDGFGELSSAYIEQKKETTKPKKTKKQKTYTPFEIYA